MEPDLLIRVMLEIDQHDGTVPDERVLAKRVAGDGESKVDVLGNHRT